MNDIGRNTSPVSPNFDITHSIHTQSKEMEAWEAMVDYTQLSPLELKIHQRHITANRASFWYKDSLYKYLGWQVQVPWTVYTSIK